MFASVEGARHHRSPHANPEHTQSPRRLYLDVISVADRYPLRSAPPVSPIAIEAADRRFGARAWFRSLARSRQCDPRGTYGRGGSGQYFPRYQIRPIP